MITGHKIRLYRITTNSTHYPIPTEDGTTQIDHIVVSKYGVFVIETKNLKGWIFGSPIQKKWIQKIYSHTNSFQNPLHQNYKHIKELIKHLSIEEEMFHSVVVFIGESSFKTPMPENVLDKDYAKYIESKVSVLLSDIEVHNIIKAIESRQLERSVKTNKEHVRHLKEKAANKTTTTNNCPKCGNSLVKRVARKGVTYR